MARNIEVTFDDGEKYVFENAPDNVTPAMATEKAQTQFGKKVLSTELEGAVLPKPSKAPVAEGAGTLEKIMNSGTVRNTAVTGSGLGQGIMSLPALAADASSLVAENLPGVGPALKYLRSQFGVPEKQGMAMMDAVGKFGVKPETAAEQNLFDVGSGVGGAMLGGPTNLVRNALVGAASGEGSNLGRRLTTTPENPTGGNPLAIVGGSILGGGIAQGAAHLATRLRPQSAELAREMMEGITPEQLSAAKAFQAKAAANNTPVDLAQAVHAVGVPNSNMATMRDALANSKHGNQVQARLNAQSRDLELAGDSLISGLPGPTWSKQASANAVQEAATKTVQGAKDLRSGEVRSLYDKIGELPEGSREKLLSSIDDLMAKPGNTEAFTKAANTLKSRLGGGELAEDAAVVAALQALNDAPRGKGKALAAQAVSKAVAAAKEVRSQPLHAKDVDVAISDVVGTFKGTPLSPATPRASGQVKGLGGTVNETFKELSPEVVRAENRFAQISQEVVDPLKQSVVGNLATRRGYLPDVEASTAKLEKIFSSGSDAQVAVSARDIPKMFNDLKAVDPEAVPAAAKAFLRSRLDKAFEALPGETVNGAVTSPAAARALYEATFKTRGQEQGMKDIVAGIARSYDLPEDQMVKGMQHFMQVTRAMSKAPPTVGGSNWKDIAKAGGKSTMADVARLYGFMPFYRIANKIEDATLAKTFQQFDEILTSPEGADLLLKLAKMPNMSDKAMIAIGQFGATAAAANASPDKVEE